MDTTVTVHSKPWYTSRTLLANLAVAALMAADYATTNQLSFTTEEWFVTGVAVLNIALRFTTKQPVSISRGEPVAVPSTPK